MPLSVSEEHAKICAEYLTEHWKDGSLVLYEMRPGTRKHPLTLLGFATYPKTLQEFNVEEQRLATLMILWKDLKRVRIRLPGFFECCPKRRHRPRHRRCQCSTQWPCSQI